MNETTVKYFNDVLEKCRTRVSTSGQVIESLQFQKQEYLKQIENSKGEIDMAYDVFSAKPIKNQFYRDQIKNFQEQVDKIDLQLEQQYCIVSDAETEIKNIEACLEELKKVESELKEKAYELEQQEVICLKKEDIESLIYKCENSKSFFAVDKDRSLMELDEVVKCLRKLVGTI